MQNSTKMSGVKMTPACRILHILPHAGGGVGTVLRAFLAAEVQAKSPYEHMIFSIEQLNDVTRAHFDTLGIVWLDNTAAGIRKDRIPELIGNADIVLVHWWNHPLLMQLLVNGLPPARLAIWSHVNGYYSPQIFLEDLFELPDLFIFSSYASLDAPVVKDLSKETQERIRVIRSCAGIPPGAESKVAKLPPFRMGYFGTVEDLKMHPDFLKICISAEIPTPCVVAGGPAHEKLREEAKKLGVLSHFDIRGPVENPYSLLRQLHVLAYPLVPSHYGTGEQVITEAMAFGAVPVVLDNPPERALVQHKITGYVARDPEEFSATLRYLADNPAELDYLSANAWAFVRDKCGIEHSQRSFHSLFDELMAFPKRPRRLSLPAINGISDESPYHLFLFSCGDDQIRRIAGSLISQAQYEGEIPAFFCLPTRGSPAHYLHFLGPDERLEKICEHCGIGSG